MNFFKTQTDEIELLPTKKKQVVDFEKVKMDGDKISSGTSDSSATAFEEEEGSSGIDLKKVGFEDGEAGDVLAKAISPKAIEEAIQNLVEIPVIVITNHEGTEVVVESKVTETIEIPVETEYFTAKESFSAETTIDEESLARELVEIRQDVSVEPKEIPDLESDEITEDTEFEIIREISTPSIPSVDGDAPVEPLFKVRKAPKVSTNPNVRRFSAASVIGSVFRTNPILNQVTKELEDLVENKNGLSEFDVKGFSLSKTQAGKIVQALKTNNSLVKLNLSYAGIDTQSATEIAKALAQNNTVKYLNLESNKIGAAGIAEFAKSLMSNNTLLELNLNNQNFVTKSGSEAEQLFAKALKVNTTLIKLVLPFRGASDRTSVDRSIARNKELARRQRMENIE